MGKGVVDGADVLPGGGKRRSSLRRRTLPPVAAGHLQHTAEQTLVGAAAHQESAITSTGNKGDAAARRPFRLHPPLRQDFGVAAYSETAQLYLTANCRYGITLSAASMTPQDYADLDALYAKGDTP